MFSHDHHRYKLHIHTNQCAGKQTQSQTIMCVYTQVDEKACLSSNSFQRLMSGLCPGQSSSSTPISLIHVFTDFMLEQKVPLFKANFSHVSGRMSNMLYRNMPACNLLPSSAINFSGCMPTDHPNAKAVWAAVHSASISFCHQHHNTIPTIVKAWQHEQKEIIKERRTIGSELILSGDCRYYSPYL